ncbi:M56 family metallopeptidase [Pedobacter cryotolerans]|uniref:M56 family metallopeptidase n=1 Tax=Pedobacter cryotolerans TaxID=2571270 RepID=A0A4U1C7R0_9SPHI|nr:M56 family metallopeptidase [Pedobacter cryotolerans]TKC01501.1 M56 family metallopeptidase [Pedobacter cryotolerans]
MPHFFIILLKINLVLILFAAAYYFILRKLTFYVINRLFLVFGILFSTIYPFIDLTDFFYQNQQAAVFVPEINQQVKSLMPSNLIIKYWQWIGASFYVGVAFMAFRLFIQFLSLIKIHRKSSPGIISNFKVRILNEAVGPFSFWQTVYINPALHNENELNTILTHEQIHVKQWHTLDIILAELSVVFYWFNPGIWLMKRAVKENLEFITDEKILKRGMDKKAYQYSLLDVGNLVPAIEIVNNFNLSDLKKRIKMMNAKRSSKFSLSRYLLVLPILLLSTLAFTVAKKEEITAQFKPIKNVLASVNILDTLTTAADINSSIPKREVVKVKSKKIIKQSTDSSSSKNINLMVKSVFSTLDSLTFKTGEDHHKKFTFSFKQNQSEASGQLNGIVKKSIIFLKTDTSKTTASVERRNEVLNLLVQNNLPLETDKTADKENKVIIRAYKVSSKFEPSSDKNVSFYLDGKKVTKEELDQLNSNEISSVSVVKGEKGGEVRITGKGAITKN